jgi:hypothetical protein
LIASSVRPFLRAGLYAFLEEFQGVRSRSISRMREERIQTISTNPTSAEK